MEKQTLAFGQGTQREDRQTAALVGDGAVLHCAKSVEAHDYHGYACTLALPAALRRQAFALRAFNVEQSQVLENARKPSLALMRFRWWRDAVSKLGNQQEHNSSKPKEPVPAHPVARALDHAFTQPFYVHERNSDAMLSELKPLLNQCIAAREDDARLGLDNSPQPPDTAWLEAYGERAYGSLLVALLSSHDARSQAAEDAASHIGAANGIAALLASLPQHLRNGRCYVPADVCAHYGISAGSLASSMAGGNDAVRDVAYVAYSRLRAARTLRHHIPRRSRLILLPAVSASLTLASLRRSGFDVFNARSQNNMQAAFSLGISAALRRY